MSMLNWLGFAVCLCGISLHVGLKTYYSKSKCSFLRLVLVVLLYLQSQSHINDIFKGYINMFLITSFLL